MSTAGKRLLIDLGNTRVKWAWQSLGRPELDDHGAEPVAAGLSNCPFLAHQGVVAGALASNVAGDEPGRELARLVRDRLGADLVFARPGRKACGVTAAYANPSNLGADRWAAMLGAHALGPHNYCIVDAGSAVTMDFLLADGRHLGGYIAPGRDMSLTAMAQGTADLGSRLADHSDTPADIGPGTDSAEAIRKGVLASQIGLVRIGMEMLTALGGRTPRLLLTGGESDLLLATGALPEARLIPDLVLRGLAALALELSIGPE